VRFYDIVVQVAIIRPGPIVGQMVNPFLQRRQGREDVTYPHPSLEPVLKRTLGVPLFQEQLLRIAMIAANFTGGEAEELRRAMGFKRSQARMKEIEARLRAGMTQNGIPQKAQEEIILSITSFALYGFPESHAASFALIAYASAYLKCHYLAAFTAALLNNQPMGFYSPATIVKDAQRHGLKVLPVDVTRSEWLCTLERTNSPRRHRGTENCKEISPYSVSPCLRGENDGEIALRMGLRYVRGLREEAGQALASERARILFTSIHDLTRRVRELRKDELTTLAEIGALNSVGISPRRHGGTEENKKIEKLSGIGNSANEEVEFNNQQSKIKDPSVPPCRRGENDPARTSALGARYSVLHRRDALWQVERTVRSSGPLLEQNAEPDEP